MSGGDAGHPPLPDPIRASDDDRFRSAKIRLQEGGPPADNCDRVSHRPRRRFEGARGALKLGIAALNRPPPARSLLSPLAPVTFAYPRRSVTMSVNFPPLHDRVVVRRLEQDQKTAGGIIIPDTAQEKPSEGEVLAVGPGA